MTSVLVDTSVWVAHFRARNPTLVELLSQDRVLVHPWIVAEIACGTPPDRARTLADLQWLKQARQASLAEVLSMVERHRLYGLGCGLVDMMLLACTTITPQASLWTLDRRLHGLAQRLGCAFEPS
ncbi:type II toxin-antitoxin system VapC family toxin [Tepidimonas aquatica]|uniref:Ribonuclease VapC32 n=1 Tax=Tepidimonas aquatica TaxID=247482 RepID=A0A554WVZ4_9BURK|nr:PIN domain-containing protein [Tepidimonas aquatica]TSE27750.1 Ribonuclease VapC32 [Tepidimonas aquatica]